MGSNQETPACAKCLEILESIVDQEATLEEEVFFRKHIDKCSACLGSYELQVEVKRLLKKNVGKVQVPEDLALRIKELITAEHN